MANGSGNRDWFSIAERVAGPFQLTFQRLSSSADRRSGF
jgi:hypothetical protein